MRRFIVVFFVIIHFSAFAKAADASLLAYYPFEGSANDESGRGYNGQVYGAVQTTGYSGQAYNFSGDDFIRISNLDINATVRPQLTMGAWVRTTNHYPIRQVISHDGSGFDRSLGVDYRGGGTGYWGYWSAFSGTGAVLGGEQAVLNRWTFLAVAYDQSISSVMLYVDGNAYTETGWLGPGCNFTNIAHNPTAGEFFIGDIDEVFFFDDFLTTAQLDDIRRNGVNPVPEPLSITLFGLAGASIAFLKRRKANV